MDLWSATVQITDWRRLLGPVLRRAARLDIGCLTGGRSCGLIPGWRAGHWFLAMSEDLDDAHRAAAAWAWFAQREGGDFWLSVLGFGLVWRLYTGQRADFGEVGPARATGQKAAMTDAVEPVG